MQKNQGTTSTQHDPHNSSYQNHQEVINAVTQDDDAASA